MAVLICATAGGQAGPQPRLISVDRSFKSSPIPNPPDDWEVQFEHTDWAAKFLAIDPARTLMLSDCSSSSPWCGKAFDFESVFGKAAAVAGLSLKDGARAWYTAAATGRFKATFPTAVLPWKGEPQMNGRFQALAIVNRMDLARYLPPKDGVAGSWTGAELRFVYGLVPQTPQGAPRQLRDADRFTIILEFQVPPCTWGQFRTLATKWMALTTASVGYLSQLNDAVAESHLDQSKLVRLRMNRNLGGKWGLSQWEFHPEGFVPAPLTDQIDPAFRQAAPGSGDYKRYLSLWGPLTATQQDTGSIAIDQAFLAPNEMAYSGESLDTPAGMCNADVYTRNILGMQQCSFCHTNETGTNFAHIPNRPVGQSSQLSAFITGNADGKIGKLSILQLWYAPDDVFSNISIPYFGLDASGNQCPPPASPASRSFNDLARRALFLAAVLAFDKESAENAYLIQVARTNFSH